MDSYYVQNYLIWDWASLRLLRLFLYYIFFNQSLQLSLSLPEALEATSLLHLCNEKIKKPTFSNGILCILCWKQRNYTFSNGIPGIFMSKTKKLYVFQWYSKYFHSKTLKTIRFPMVFQVFQPLRPFETEPHRLQHLWGIQKPGKPLENI